LGQQKAIAFKSYSAYSDEDDEEELSLLVKNVRRM